MPETVSVTERFVKATFSEETMAEIGQRLKARLFVMHTEMSPTEGPLPCARFAAKYGNVKSIG